MVQVVVLKENEVTPRPDLVGKWLDHTHYHTLVEGDLDVYLPPDCANFTAEESCDNNMNCSGCKKGLSEKNIVFKFRKNFFTQEEADAAYAGLRDAAVETQNRGVAGGPRTEKCGGRDWVTDEQFDLLEFFAYKNTVSIFGDYNPKSEVDVIRNKYKQLKQDDSRGVVWLSEQVKVENFVFNDFIDLLCELTIEEAKEKALYVLTKLISKTTYANVVNSGIAGWYDRYPRIPYGRPTTYTRDNPEKFSKAYPFLQSLAKGFKDMLPWRYGNQKRAAESVDSKFVVPETPFTTITVNKNFRTAAHYDPANMEDGFANLCVISNNDNYEGCYLVFPEIGYAVNIRPRDLLLVNNQAGLHGNTPLILNDTNAERISIIAFFHEGMLTLGSFEYEDTRREFVDSRRLNPDHPEQRYRWNGISPGLWESDEWVEFLLTKPTGKEWLKTNHKDLYDRKFGNTIDSFF
jgi:hypothetical protein